MIDCLRSLLRPVVCLPSAASVLALALTAGAVAQTAPASSTPATPVASAPAAATVPASSMASRVLACTACHGKEGRATPDGYFPRIAGKPAGYLANQLLNFRDGRRSYPQRGYLIEHLTDDYLREMADYFAAQDLPYPPPLAPQVPPAVLARGRVLVQRGDVARNIPACVACHGSGVAGAPKFGDKAAWAPFIAKGMDDMVQNATKGIGAMPPKGGSTASDADFKAAIQYMADAAK